MTSSVQWVVRVTVVTKDEDCYTVGMAEDDEGEGSYLTIQSGVNDPDAQQRQLGWDTYCVMNETGAVCYGGIERASVTNQKIFFRFSPEAAVELSLADEDLELELHADADVEALRSGLRTVLTYGDSRKRPTVLDV
ncbi:Imm10 family immunity protein [Streptomyces sp. NPDC056296]|uniref:Imm10 family immunity protein n=1 Tax=Streptomyces sp. NPDC056296 TaxID=3345775 RepID=UPI0035DB1EED